MMTTLNKLPDGSPSPYYKCTAVDIEGEEHTATLQYWPLRWDGRL